MWNQKEMWKMNCFSLLMDGTVEENRRLKRKDKSKKGTLKGWQIVEKHARICSQ